MTTGKPVCSGHDNSYKYLFSHPEMIIALLEGFVDPELVRYFDLDTLEKCNGSYVSDDLRDREDDIIWRVKCRDHWLYVYLLLEFQSTVDRWMAVRIATYCGLLYQDLIKSGELTGKDCLPAIVPITLYNGKSRWTAPTGLSELIQPMPGVFKVLQLDLNYLLIDESSYSETELPEDNISAILFHLENSEDAESLEAGLEKLIAWCRKPERDNLRRAFSVWIKRVLRTRKLVDEETGFRDLSEEKAMLAERVDEWIQEWERQGLEKGLQQGIELGIDKGIKQTALNLLDKLSDIDIAESTGLSVEEVARLREESKGQ